MTQSDVSFFVFGFAKMINSCIFSVSFEMVLKVVFPAALRTQTLDHWATYRGETELFPDIFLNQSFLLSVIQSFACSSKNKFHHQLNSAESQNQFCCYPSLIYHLFWWIPFGPYSSNQNATISILPRLLKTEYSISNIKCYKHNSFKHHSARLSAQYLSGTLLIFGSYNIP